MNLPARSPHRAWIEIDHSALADNLAVLRRLAGEGRSVIGVVKANAYGHGAVEVSRTLLRHGTERLAVATLGEGLALRAAGIEAPILVLWGLGDPEAAAALAADLEPVVYDAAGVDRIERAAADAGRRHRCSSRSTRAWGRQGSEPAAAVELALRIARSRHLLLAGTFSHLAVPGEDEAYTDVQLMRFAQALDAMRSAGADPGIVHVAATGGLLASAGAFGDAVRPGLGLYGMVPGWATDRDDGLRPILTLKALPLRIFELAAGEVIGYGLRFRAERATRIATLGIGYGDGWPRVHANNGRALVRGVQRVPIVGAMSMDGSPSISGDVDDVTYGDEFALIGEQMGARITPTTSPTNGGPSTTK